MGTFKEPQLSRRLLENMSFSGYAQGCLLAPKWLPGGYVLASPDPSFGSLFVKGDPSVAQECRHADFLHFLTEFSKDFKFLGGFRGAIATPFI